ncbi:phage tail tape measure protein [Streptomyces lydicus]
MGSIRLAAVTAGAHMMSMATNGTKALKATRTASLGLLAAFTAAALAAANFEKAMSQVRAATGESKQGMAQLSKAALDAGNATKYSASQAAEAEAELAKAGIGTADIVGGALKGSLALAASGQMELGDSAVVAAQAMNAFGLAGRDVPHIADVISAGAGKSATNVHDMSMAFRQAALVSNQTGLSLEDTVGTLSLFAQNALTGSDAGTSLKTMLQRLTPQSKEAQAAMDQLGFSAYDSQGNFVGLSEMAQRLHTAFGALTPEARNAAFATIFGSDAVRSATILYQAGASGVDKWTKAVNDSGYASRVAATMTDNLAGDWERLKSALETGLISSGSSANGVLRGMAKALTGVVNWYNNLSPSVQKGVTALAGIVGVVGLVGSAFLLMLPRIMAVRAELVGLGVTAAGTRTALMGLSKVGLVVGALLAAKEAVDSLGDSLKPQPPNATKMQTALINMATSGKVAGQMAKSFGKDLNGLGDALTRINNPGGLTAVTDWMGNLPLGGGDAKGLTEAKDKLKAIDEALKGMVESGNVTTAKESFAALAKEAQSSGHSTGELKAQLPGYTDALANSDAQQKATAQSQKGMGDAAAKTKTEFEDQRSAAEKLTDALKTLNGLNITAAEGEISFRQSLADLTSAVKENGHSLDTTSEKGRKVKSAFLDAAKAAQEHAQAVADQKGSVEAGNAVLEQDISALKRTMRQAKFSETAIRQLTSAYAQLPGAKNTKVEAVNAAKTMTELDTIRKKVENVPPGKHIDVKAPSAPAIAALRDIGYKVTTLPNHQVRITVPTSGPASSIAALRREIASLRDKVVSISITRYFRSVGNPQGMKNAMETSANGSLRVERYAAGGMRENHVAQIAKAGTWRLWAEDETGGEAYIPLALSKRQRSRAIAEETVRRLGGKGIAWNADGSVRTYASGGLNGFSYTPTGAAVLGGTGDAKQRYDKNIERLKTAWSDLDKAVADAKKKADSLRDAERNLSRVRRGHHTATQLRAAQEKVDKARTAKRSADSKVASERKDVYSADAALGVKKGSRAPSSFNLAAYQKQLNDSVYATNKWRTNLQKIAARGGEDVRQMLQEMGEDGYALVNSLAGASTKQFNDIITKLRKTGGVAQATLSDFTRQLGASTKESSQFAADLQTLALKGFGTLAQALAAQGDDTAVTLAHQAATGSTADVARANAAVKANQGTLTGDDLSNSLLVLAALRSKRGAGIADVLGAGVDFATLRTLVPRMLAQINKLPSMYKSTFLAQWAGQSGHAAMARGGILTRPTAVLAAEAGDAESWIPVNGSSRSAGLLARTAGLMGYQLIPAGRYGAARDGGPQTVREGDRNTTVNLYGAKQTSGEQARDIARHLAFVG